jgi:hypothetical protein
MKKASILILMVGLSSASTFAGVFTIGGYKFDEKNSVSKVTIVEGSGVRDHSAQRFGRYSQEYVSSPLDHENSFEKFDRARSLGRLMGRRNSGKIDYARFLCLPDRHQAPPTPNVDRVVVQLGWGEAKGIKNEAGPDFVIFESGSWEGFEVAVVKAGATEPTRYRYQFATSKDSIHEANAVPFDLSDFGVADGEMISSIRVRNIFNSKAAGGGDKVDQENGSGNVLLPADAGYDKGFPILSKAGGAEFTVDQLSADLVYAVALRDVEELKVMEAPQPPPVEPAPAKPAKTNAVAAPVKKTK